MTSFDAVMCVVRHNLDQRAEPCECGLCRKARSVLDGLVRREDRDVRDVVAEGELETQTTPTEHLIPTLPTETPKTKGERMTDGEIQSVVEDYNRLAENSDGWKTKNWLPAMEIADAIGAQPLNDNAADFIGFLLDKLRAADEVLARLPSIVQGITEIMELRPCEYDRDGDCGNWPECGATCPFRQLRELVGIKPQEDGGIDKQAADAGKGAGRG